MSISPVGSAPSFDTSSSEDQEIALSREIEYRTEEGLERKLSFTYVPQTDGSGVREIWFKVHAMGGELIDEKRNSISLDINDPSLLQGTRFTHSLGTIPLEDLNVDEIERVLNRLDLDDADTCECGYNHHGEISVISLKYDPKDFPDNFLR